MLDERLREIERAAESGSPEEKAALLVSRERDGSLSADALMLAAFMGDEAARLATDHKSRYGIPWAWNDELSASAWTAALESLNDLSRTASLQARIALAASVHAYEVLDAAHRRGRLFEHLGDNDMIRIALTYGSHDPTVTLERAQAAIFACEDAIVLHGSVYTDAAAEACRLTPTQAGGGAWNSVHDPNSDSLWWRGAGVIMKRDWGWTNALSRCLSVCDEIAPGACEAAAAEVVPWILEGVDLPALRRHQRTAQPA